MDVEKIITVSLAIYGALLSTILGLRELFRERKRILIFLQLNEYQMVYSIIITNVGHRPITLLDISMDLPREYVPRYIIVPRSDDPFPVTLTDGQVFTLNLSESLSAEVFEANENIKLVVYDTENRKYRKFKKLSYNEKDGVRRPSRK
jgi:hypothetical protein